MSNERKVRQAVSLSVILAMMVRQTTTGCQPVGDLDHDDEVNHDRLTAYRT